MELLLFLGVIVGAVVAQFTNSSLTLPTGSETGEPSSTSPSPTSTYTNNVCCFIQPANVGLDQWWNQTITATVATVVTQYLQYNNTVVTTTSTEYNTTATRTDIWSLDTNVLEGAGIYDKTTFLFGTTTVASGITVVSPKPFWVVTEVWSGIAYEQTYIDSGTTRKYCNRNVEKLSETSIRFTPGLVYLPSQSSFISTRADVQFGDDFRDLFKSELERSGTTLSGLESCYLGIGEGAPTLHVPVSALTAFTDTTIAMGGSFTTAPPGGSPPENSDPPSSPGPTPPPPSPGTSVPSVPAETENPRPPPPNSPPSPPNNPNQPTPPGNPNAPPPGGVTPSPPAQPPIQPPTLTIGTNTIPITIPPAQPGSSSQGVIFPGSTTLLPGSTIVIDSSTTLSLDPSGSNIVILGPTDTSTVQLPGPASPAPTPPPFVDLGASSFTLSSVTVSGTVGIVLPNGETLLPGTTTFIDGTAWSLAPSATQLVVGSSTILLSSSSAAVIDLGSTPFTLSTVIISGTTGVVLPNGGTLLPGSTTVIDGTTWYLGPGATELVVGTSTIGLPKETDASTTSGDGLATSTSVGSPAEFTGGAVGGLIPQEKNMLILCGIFLHIVLLSGLAL